MSLAWLIVAAFTLIPFPRTPHGQWLTVDRQVLAIVLTPAILAMAGCWRLGTPHRHPSDSEDQPVTRWALRFTAAVWPIPLLFLAGPLLGRAHEWRRLLELVSWSGVPATLLFFRRLKYLARRIPSRWLVQQCNVIGSQLPIAMVLLCGWARHEFGGERVPEAFRYAVTAPLPGMGLPWPLTLKISELQWIRWEYVLNDLESVLFICVAAVQLWTGVVVVQFLIALMRVRRGGVDRQLVEYCRARVKAAV